MRAWEVTSRGRSDNASSEPGAQQIGLEFREALLTKASICSFSCVILYPPVVFTEYGGVASESSGIGRGRLSKRKGPGDRLCCVVGSDNGFVQAWEMSLSGERGIGHRPLWAQKVRLSTRD